MDILSLFSGINLSFAHPCQRLVKSHSKGKTINDWEICITSYCNQRQVGELGMDLVESQFKIPHLHAGCVEQRQGHFSVTEIGGNLLLLASLQIHVQNLLCTFHDVLRTMYYARCTMHYVLRTMHFVLCICKYKILVLSTT